MAIVEQPPWNQAYSWLQTKEPAQKWHPLWEGPTDPEGQWETWSHGSPARAAILWDRPLALPTPDAGAMGPAEDVHVGFVAP